MKIEVFENAITAKGLKPFHVFLYAGRHVDWFVCFEENDFDDETVTLVVYDRKGHAYKQQNCDKQILKATIYSFRYVVVDQIIAVNQYILEREASLDIRPNRDDN